MKESKSEKTIKAVEESGTRFSKKLIALKGFKHSRRGDVYVEVKKGDDVSKLGTAKLALLKLNGVI